MNPYCKKKKRAFIFLCIGAHKALQPWSVDHGCNAQAPVDQRSIKPAVDRCRSMASWGPGHVTGGGQCARLNVHWRPLALLPGAPHLDGGGGPAVACTYGGVLVWV